MSEKKKFFIAGVQHHEMHKVINDLAIGDELDLIPEPTNKYDPNAVRIEYDGTMCGYVPKKFSAEVSAMLETDFENTTCVITVLQPDGKPWEWCEVVVGNLDDVLDNEEDGEYADPIDPDEEPNV